MVYIMFMKQKHIWLTEPQIEALEELSRVSGENQSVIIRRALDEYLENRPHRVEWRTRNDNRNDD